MAKIKGKVIGSLADDLLELGAEIVEGPVVASKVDDAVKAARAAEKAREKTAQMYEGLFGEGSKEFTFDRSKVIVNDKKTGELKLNKKALSKERSRMNKEYDTAYESAKKKSILPVTESGKEMSRNEYKQLMNRNEVRETVSKKKVVEDIDRRQRAYEQTRDQMAAVTKYGGSSKSISVEEMQARQKGLRNKISQNTQEVRQKKTNTNKAEANKYFTKANIQTGIGLGVGGYLVINMFNQGGKMSNAELYGQQQQYGY